jgi:hypothetical protein
MRVVARPTSSSAKRAARSSILLGGAFSPPPSWRAGSPHAASSCPRPHRSPPTPSGYASSSASRGFDGRLPTYRIVPRLAGARGVSSSPPSERLLGPAPLTDRGDG